MYRGHSKCAGYAPVQDKFVAVGIFVSDDV